MLAFVPITDRNLMQKKSEGGGGAGFYINYTKITLLYPLAPLSSRCCWRVKELELAVLKRSNGQEFVDSNIWPLMPPQYDE